VINLLNELFETARDVSHVAAEQWLVTDANLTRVIENMHLGNEIDIPNRWIIGWVTNDVSILEF
jgi:hypothetical protein